VYLDGFNWGLALTQVLVRVGVVGVGVVGGGVTLVVGVNFAVGMNFFVGSGGFGVAFLHLDVPILLISPLLFC